MCQVNTSSSSASFKTGKGFQKRVSSGGLYVSIVSFVSGGGKSKGGKVCGIFKFGLTKDFLTSFCGGGSFGGNDFCRIPTGTGGVLVDVDGFDVYG